MCNAISTFVKKNQTLCVLTGGLSIIGFLAWRLVVWLTSLCGAAKKTDQISRQLFATTPRIEGNNNPQQIYATIIPLTPSPIYNAWPKIPMVTLDLVAGFLTLSGFATFSCVCTKSAGLFPEQYFRKNKHYIEMCYHHKPDLSYPDKWKKGILKAASVVTEFSFYHPEAVIAFPPLVSYFSNLNSLKLSRYVLMHSESPTSNSQMSSVAVALPSLFSSSVKNLSLADEGYENLFPVINHPPLQRLNLTTIPLLWWKHPQRPVFPSLRVLNIQSYHAINDRLLGIGQQTSLEELQLNLTDGEWELARKLLLELPNLRSLSISKHLVFSPEEIQTLVPFRNVKRLFLQSVELNDKVIASLKNLYHVESLELILQIKEIPGVLKKQLELIDSLAEIKNVTKITIDYQKLRETNTNELGLMKRVLEKLGPKIVRIKCRGSVLINSELLNQWHRLINCESICLQNTEIDCFYLKRLLRSVPHLERLTIENCKIVSLNDQLLEMEKGMGFRLVLKICELYGFFITERALKELANWEISSEFLLLHHPKKESHTQYVDLSDQDLIQFLNRKKLGRLVLTGVTFTDISLFHISERHKGLKYFGISQPEHIHVSITDAGIKAIGSLPLLEGYYFSNAYEEHPSLSTHLDKRLARKLKNIYDCRPSA